MWKKQVDPTYTKELRYGVGSSPVLTGDAVVVVRDKEYGEVERDTGWIGAFHRETGEEMWRQTWQDNCCSYVTPVVNVREGRTEIVLAHSAKITGYDAETGEITWNHLYEMLQPVASPIAEDDVVCYMGGAHNDRGNICLRIKGFGPEAKVEQLWFVPRAAPESASPVLFEGALWAVNEAGVLLMYDYATGELLRQRRLEGGNISAPRSRSPAAISTSTTPRASPPWSSRPPTRRASTSSPTTTSATTATTPRRPSPAAACCCATYKHLYCIEKETQA